MSFGTVRQWHWISSAVCLAGMLLFAVTGFTLNHAAQIEANPTVSTLEAQLPEPLQQQLLDSAPHASLPPNLQSWLESTLHISLSDRAPEWEDSELYVALPRPGGDAWLSLDLESGELLYEETDRGWISWFNDLHKGRNTGALWSVFIDLFAGVCIIFSLTGFWLLLRQAQMRRSTWPFMAAGLLIPVLIALLFMH